ncbi:MAG: phage adaptor protein, partial [Geminicoccaceae bacterium]
VYHIAVDALQIRPSPDGDTEIKIYYYAGIHPLSDTLTQNWLLAFHPHVYFYGALGQLFKFSNQRQRRDKWLGRFERALDDVMTIDAIDRYNGTPASQYSRIIPDDRPLLADIESVNQQSGIVPGEADSGPGIEAALNFPVMGLAANLQASAGVEGNLNFPVMDLAATLVVPGQITGALSFPVMNLGASLSSNVLLLSENFQGTVPSWNLSTPGVDDPRETWSREENATPTTSTGPAGGADPTTRVPTATNGFAYTESSGSAGPSWSLETPDIDASLGTVEMFFDLHMRFGSLGGLTDGTLAVEGWDGAAWSVIGATVTGSQQGSAGAAYLPSTGFSTYDSSSFSNVDFKFRFLFVKGGNLSDANYDCAIDNVTIFGPVGAI